MEENKRFYRGLLTGIFSTLGVVMVVIIIFLIFGKDFVYIGGTSNKNEITKSIDGSEKEIFEKIKALTYLVDKESLYDIDDKNVIEGIYKGIFESLGDDYAAYYTVDEFKKFKESTEGEYCGIGAYISEKKETKELVIASTMEGSPAEKAGLKKDDVIVQVDDKEVGDKDSDTVISWIKGEPGTEVSIKVARKGEKDFLTLKMKREKIEVPTVTYKLQDKDIANIAVSGFDSVTPQQFEDALNKAKKDKTKGMIIDLRGNPGGNLEVVVKMLDKFVKKDDMIVYTEAKGGKRVQECKAESEPTVDTPLVVLVDGSSASASEIFAGNIKDHKIGTLVGEKTFGKGIVQTLLPLQDGSAVKFTTSKYFLPSGKCIHKEGVKPDVEVKFDAQDYVKNNKDNQLEKAIEELRKKIK